MWNLLEELYFKMNLFLLSAHTHTHTHLIGAPGKYRYGALYVCTHLLRDQPWVSFICRDACCCTMCPLFEFNVSTMFFHVHVIMGFFHLHLFFHVVDHKIPINLPLLRQVLTKDVYKRIINLTIEPLTHFFKNRDEEQGWVRSRNYYVT